MKIALSKLSSPTFYLTIFVILWGALVRITHSGAGCGRHWPLCDGQIIPLDPTLAMTIEFTHRLTSGASAIFVLLLFLNAKKSKPDSRLLKFATYALIFMGIEVLIGASLVLFGWVKDNTTTTRAYVMGFHLINSFLLVASLYLVKALESGKATLRKLVSTEYVLLLGFLLVASMGAITSLGDTLFPSTSLAEGFAKDFSDSAHILIQLRIIHPVLAVLMSFFLIRYGIEASREDARKSNSIRLIILVLLQLILGASTVILLAPSTLQILHLLMALSIWCALVGLTSTMKTPAP